MINRKCTLTLFILRILVPPKTPLAARLNLRKYTVHRLELPHQTTTWNCMWFFCSTTKIWGQNKFTIKHRKLPKRLGNLTKCQRLAKVAPKKAQNRDKTHFWQKHCTVWDKFYPTTTNFTQLLVALLKDVHFLVALLKYGYFFFWLCLCLYA